VVVAHSEKESAAPTFKRTFGFHPLLAFCDHGPEGTGEPLAALLRPGSANANTAADHITVLDLALAQLPAAERGSVLVRGDSGAGTKAFLAHITALGLAFSVGFPATDPVAAAIELVPPAAWTPAYDGDGQPREGAEVAELTGLLPRLTDVGWPPAMRVVARRERPHPGAQLRLTDHEGWRITLFATNTLGGQLADLEVKCTVGGDWSAIGEHTPVWGMIMCQWIPAMDASRNNPYVLLARQSDGLRVWAKFPRFIFPRVLSATSM